MTDRSAARTFLWLVRDTFRQSLASGICWLLAATIVLCVAVCLSAGIRGNVALEAPQDNPNFLPSADREAQDPGKLRRSGVTKIGGHLELAFGALRIPLTRDARHAVQMLELVLAGGVADTLGLLLALVWTAGFMPGFVDPRSISVLLAKPPTRSWLLMGKYLSVCVFVLTYAIVFVLGTWTAIGVKTGIWSTGYFLCVPLLLLHFAIFFSGSLLLAVWTRSTVVSVFGSIAFWALCWGMNFGRHAVAAAEKIAPESAFSNSLVLVADLGYWLLPKPADLGRLLYDALDAHDFFQPLLAQAPSVSIELSILSSLAFTGFVLWVATRHFATADY